MHFIAQITVLVALTLGATAAIAATDVTAVTPQGTLVGETTARSITVFRGIPYAVPPIGVRRWKYAEAAPDWKFARTARENAPSCMQPTQAPTFTTGTGKVQTRLFAGPQPQMSEDCLYLNVWSPKPDAATPAAKRPVMVWIHGGALMTGSGSLANYDGSALAAKGAVIVTINYRLGLFGFYAHPELSAESPTGTSGNYGLSDQIEALRWVRRNIAAFGGDPENVTIFGESAGSWSVGLLLSSPQAKGLFHRAIGESGNYIFPMLNLKTAAPGKLSAEGKGAAFAQNAVGGGIDQLRALSAAELEAKATALSAVKPAELAIIDGAIITRSVRETFLTGTQHAVPLLVGFNSDEGSGLSDSPDFPPVPADGATYAKFAQGLFGSLAERGLKLYPPGDPTAAVFDFYRDVSFGAPMQQMAQAAGKANVPAYLYYFSHTPPYANVMRGLAFGKAERKLGAHHGAEIPYVFGTIGKGLAAGTAPTARDRQLADLMGNYWVSFARSGNPNGAGRPVWQPYRDTDRRFVLFNNGARPGVNLLPGTLELQTEIYPTLFGAR